MLAMTRKSYKDKNVQALIFSRFCNGLPGLATAFADRSPVFCVTSSQPLRDAETNALQGFHDQVVLAKPVTKFAHRSKQDLVNCLESLGQN